LINAIFCSGVLANYLIGDVPVKLFRYVSAAVIAVGMWSSSALAAVVASDVVFIVDESGSMGGEHAFLSDVIDDLDAALLAAGVVTRNYGLIGFGSSNPAPRDVGTAGLNDAATTKADFGSLLLNGGFEDGWAGINYAMNNLTFNAGAATNFILVTDEDRDSFDGALTYAGILADMKRQGIVLNSIVNTNLRDSASAVALGCNDTGTAYLPDGSGGFTTSGGCTASGGFGTTNADYVDLAWATGGAAWDLNQLRAGGLVADGFASAFIDIKVQEIITPPGIPVPLPGVLLLTGIGGFGLFSRRRKSA
jgi:hypothetical protein